MNIVMVITVFHTKEGIMKQIINVILDDLSHVFQDQLHTFCALRRLCPTTSFFNQSERSCNKSTQSLRNSLIGYLMNVTM